MGRLTAATIQCVKNDVAGWPEDADARHANELLRLLGFWRQQMLVNTFLAHHGPRVLTGLFAGMEYVTRATEGALMPRLLGAYEAELHPHLEAFRQEGVDCVIDVGCAEGFYAVGLARLLPDATIHAYDVDPKARAVCTELAARNGVGDRVVVGELFAPEDFERFAERRPLVIMDVEGAETDLLRPDLAPSLAGMRLIVETHGPGKLETLCERFAPTHEITRVDTEAKTAELPPWLKELGHLDQLLAVWEWRGCPTPWLVMRPKRA
ncbi:50S ribosomal protein L11 methyltransferase [Phenylobacterium sp. VNQ135]|uniref:50S ribosomal protein L11 methyltransferase n=1 Tax=Phenylobacterium sp. VNQ135 TaxID=3400922 RepID=UPI003BFD61C1